jgi:hypothetical protein
MARKLDEQWDLFAEIALREEGVAGPAATAAWSHLTARAAGFIAAVAGRASAC